MCSQVRQRKISSYHLHTPLSVKKPQTNPQDTPLVLLNMLMKQIHDLIMYVNFQATSFALKKDISIV